MPREGLDEIAVWGHRAVIKEEQRIDLNSNEESSQLNPI